MFGEAQSLVMNKKVIKFLQSFIAIPLLATSVPFGGLVSTPSSIVVLGDNSVMETSLITPEEMKIRKECAQAIDVYFEKINAPLAGYGKKFVEEAVKNDIDCRLLAAIGMAESTGGIHACKKVPNMPFGYGSCKFGYDSIDEAIEKVSASLGGNNPKTAKWYAGKTTEQILKTYNPDHIAPGYTKKVMKIMDSIYLESNLA